MDGVLTDNSVHVTESGEQLRRMSIRDGLGLKIALKNGFQVCIITGGRSQGVIKRLAGLGIEHVYSGVEDKWPVFQQFLRTFNLKASEICYMGDDLPDLQILQKVGLSACPADAVAEIRSTVDYISPIAGGSGCVRDVVEKGAENAGQVGGICADCDVIIVSVFPMLSFSLSLISGNTPAAKSCVSAPPCPH